jgi:ribosomal protein S18 acetylase RimI-like enzyme
MRRSVFARSRAGERSDTLRAMSSGERLPVTTRRAGPDDAPTHAELGASTFRETFEADNAPEDFASYMAVAFGEPIQRAELEDTDTTVYFAERAGAVVGYVMLREGKAPSCVASADALQVARLYARRSALGTGVGGALMQRALADAAARGKDAVWLGVWDRNHRAIRFYESWDFHQSGTQPFLLGADLQTDLVLVRRIARES